MAISPTAIALSNLTFEAFDDDEVGIVTITDLDTLPADITVTVDNSDFEVVRDDGVRILRVKDGVDTIPPGTYSITLSASGPGETPFSQTFTLTAIADDEDDDEIGRAHV